MKKLEFLVKPTEQRIKELDKNRGILQAVGLDDMQGTMSIPEPLAVNCNNGMTEEDYNSCAFVNSVCRNVIQQVIVENAEKEGRNPNEAIRDINAWVDGFLKFPFPFFNFVDYQADHYKEDNFSFNADEKVIESIVNIKGVPDLKNAVFTALHSAGEDGKLLAYSNRDRDFTYFGVITAYTQTEIFMRVICYTMHMQSTDVKALCSKTQKTSLDSSYVTYRFSADKSLMIAMQKSIQSEYVESVAEQLLEFLKKMNKRALDNFRNTIGAKEQK